MSRKYFNQVENGEFFRTETNGPVYQKFPQGTVADWFLASSINVENGCHSSCGPLCQIEIVENPTHRRATSRQVAYLTDLGVNVPGEISVKAASRLIDKAKRAQKPSCHYCGMPATGFCFFGEPACSECGGS